MQSVKKKNAGATGCNKYRIIKKRKENRLMLHSTTALSIEHLYFSYKEKEIFHDLQICFPSEECSAVMAPSGHGKTTLLYLIAGLLSPSEGIIRYPMRKPAFSMVFQESRLIHQADIASNLRLVNPKLTNTDICQQLSLTGLPREYLHKTAGQLSGGEQRRIAILRAVLAKYDILLMDEPFTGLDDVSKKLMLEYVRTHTAGKTVILVTHQQEEADYLAGKNLFVL